MSTLAPGRGYHGRAGGAAAAPKPENVVITFHAKPDGEVELAGVIEKHWTVAREMKLVPAPRLREDRLRGNDREWR